MRSSTILIAALCFFGLILQAALAKSFHQTGEDYDYKYEISHETTADPGIVIDTVPVRTKHHHHNHHLKSNRLGRLRKYFDEHQYRY